MPNISFSSSHWLTSTTPLPMFDYLAECGGASASKRWFFGAACCHNVSNWLSDEGRKVVEAAELYATGSLSEERMEAFTERATLLVARAEASFRSCARIAAAEEVVARIAGRGPAMDKIVAAQVGKARFEAARAVSFCAAGEYVAAAAAAVEATVIAASTGEKVATREKHERKQAHLVREIFGPGQPIRISESWLTRNNGCVVEIARFIIDENRPDVVPILGDALLDVGCTEPALFEHCHKGHHVRGCWVPHFIMEKCA